MNGGGDFFGAMGWALRRYAWLVVAFMVGLGVLVPFLLNKGPTTYEAQAQVGPTDKVLLQPLDPLPRIGDSVFNNGAVATAVRKTLGLPRSASVSPKYVELVAAQDNLVFSVLGHDKNAATAQKLANVAAAAFTVELNKYSKSVGQFQVQHGAPLPATPAAKLGGGKVAIGIGLAAGLIAGLAAVALLLVWRRPILDAASAEEATNAPVYGEVRLPRGSRAGDPYAVRGLAPLCRRLLANPSDTVLLVTLPSASKQLQQLGAVMSDFLNRIQRATRSSRGQYGASAVTSAAWSEAGASANGMPIRGDIRLEVATDDSLERVAMLPDGALTLLVVPSGTPLKRVRDAASEYFTGGAGGLVIVSRDGHRLRGGGKSSRQQFQPAADQPPAQEEIPVSQ
jgi:hypothetical protein